MTAKFLPLPFDRMSEADVREEVLAPLIKALGYRTGTNYDILREFALKYPKQSLGRKKPLRDPELRGRSDYVLKVSGVFSWVLEAKSPAEAIDIDSVEQAWTYACHPEVRAAYFALSNGRELRIYDTLASAEAQPVLSIRYEDFDARFPEVFNLLGPAAIERELNRRQVSRGRPLGAGLGSVAQVTSGFARYYLPSAPGTIDPNKQTIIVGGTAQRDESGYIVLHLDTQAPLPGLQAINERIGFQGIDLNSTAVVFSEDISNPSEVSGVATFTIPEGEELPMSPAGPQVRMPRDLTIEWRFKGKVALKDCRLEGPWSAELRIIQMPTVLIPSTGIFSIRLV